MKKKVLIPLIIVVVVVIAILIYSFMPGEAKEVQLTAKAMRGTFEILIPVTGELRAEKSTQIKAPDELRGRNMRIRNMKIQDMVEEGTLVDSGDWVASLDKSEADNAYKDILNNLEQVESNFTKTMLDTTIQMKQLRNDLINLKFNMEENKIALEQSMYEPPATIRQVEMNLDKAERAYEQALTNYKLREVQAKATMFQAKLSLERSQQTMRDMEIALKNFDILAPAPGMVIYKREYNGGKRMIGSEINPWDPIVAELPDLSSMVSRTFVNEIDISKIRRGQTVRLGVDAFPEKRYTGEVLSISNIGQQLPNADAKVFEVLIKIFEKDTVLRPSMTTSNKIITAVYDSVVFIPLETVHLEDSVTFVYTTRNRKQIVVLGEPNENMVIVENGLSDGQEVFLSVPAEPEKFSWDGMELAEVIRKKEAIKAARIKSMNDSLKSSPVTADTSQIAFGDTTARRQRAIRTGSPDNEQQVRQNGGTRQQNGGMRQQNGGTRQGGEMRQNGGRAQ